MRQVYFDHQASTAVLPEVVEAMTPWFAENFGSASSLHRHGVLAREALERAREQVAGLINAESPEDIIFTSGATESANLAIKGVAYASQRRGKHIVASAIEHEIEEALGEGHATAHVEPCIQGTCAVCKTG